MNRARVALAAATTLAAMAGCGAASSPTSGGETPLALTRCVGSAFTPAPVQPWLHATASAITAAAGPANHAMEDVVATPGAPATIRGKLAYGAISKDLEDEDVRVFVDACSGWTTLGDFRSGGHVLVFLTGRPAWLTATTREWLSSGGFALGPLHLAGSNAEALPTEGGVGAYKRAYLESLAAAGFLLDEAYGNATTDVFAYAQAGIAPRATWIIGPNGGSGGTQAVSGTWEPRAAAISARPAVTQPFATPGS